MILIHLFEFKGKNNKNNSEVNLNNIRPSNNNRRNNNNISNYPQQNGDNSSSNDNGNQTASQNNQKAAPKQKQVKPEIQNLPNGGESEISSSKPKQRQQQQGPKPQRNRTVNVQPAKQQPHSSELKKSISEELQPNPMHEQTTV